MSANPIDETSTDGDFDAVYQAVSETARGRWFIQEFLRRSGSANTQLILDAISKLNTGRAAPATESTSTTEVLRRELAEMSQSISQTRQEIAAIQPTGSQSPNNRIIEATGELDGIVTATERATGDILGAAENIQTCVERLQIEPGICDEIEAQIMDIFTACSFQDITGQRTTKVINVLRYLEERVNAMINVWGPDAHGEGQSLIDPHDTRPDAHLLSGPAAEGEGHDQDAIDTLLADMDSAPAASIETPGDQPAELTDDDPVEIAFDAPADAATEAIADVIDTSAEPVTDIDTSGPAIAAADQEDPIVDVQSAT